MLKIGSVVVFVLSLLFSQSSSSDKAVVFTHAESGSTPAPVFEDSSPAVFVSGPFAGEPVPSFWGPESASQVASVLTVQDAVDGSDPVELGVFRFDLAEPVVVEVNGPDAYVGLIETIYGSVSDRTGLQFVFGGSDPDISITVADGLDNRGSASVVPGTSFFDEVTVVVDSSYENMFGERSHHTVFEESLQALGAYGDWGPGYALFSEGFNVEEITDFDWFVLEFLYSIDAGLSYDEVVALLGTSV